MGRGRDVWRCLARRLAAAVASCARSLRAFRLSPFSASASASLCCACRVAFWLSGWLLVAVGGGALVVRLALLRPPARVGPRPAGPLCVADALRCLAVGCDVALPFRLFAGSPAQLRPFHTHHERKETHPRGPPFFSRLRPFTPLLTFLLDPHFSPVFTPLTFLHAHFSMPASFEPANGNAC